MFKVTIVQVGAKTVNLAGLCKTRQCWSDVAKRLMETHTGDTLCVPFCEPTKNGTYKVIYARRNGCNGLTKLPEALVCVAQA